MASPSLHRTNSHSRTDSNSFRIPIHFSSSPSSASTSSPSSSLNGRSQSHQFSLDKYEDLTWFQVIKSWLSGRIGGRNNGIGIGIGTGTRPWLRRWMILVLILVILLITMNRKDYVSSNLSYKTWREKGNSVGGGVGEWEEEENNSVPRVDRSTLEKLRLLELHYGKDEDWEEEDSILNPQYGGGGTKKDDSPPTVVNIPEVIKPDPLFPITRLPKTSTHILDSQFCPEQKGKPCSFLVAGFIGEQETKAQVHLHQLGLLALALNRTLVLPNVAKSRMGSCYSSPFTFYYSSTSLSSLGIPTISHENFLEWNERRELPPSAQIISLPGTNQSHPLGAVEIDSISNPTLVPRKVTRKLCLKSPRTRLDFNNYSPIIIYAPEGYHKNDKNSGLGMNRFGDSVIHTLRSEKVGLQALRRSDSSSSKKSSYSSPNVLILNWELRFPILSPSLLLSPDLSLQLLSTPLPFSHFPYAGTWSNLSKEIANSLEPFIAVHWRTETLLTENLVPCASALVRKIEEVYKKYSGSFKFIYLATDYPSKEIFPPIHIPSSNLPSTSNFNPLAKNVSPPLSPPILPHSGTFAKVITPQHHLAFQTFLKEFDLLRIKLKDQLKLTTFDLEIEKLNLDESIKSQLIYSIPSSSNSAGTTDTTPSKIQGLDSGLIGIIDKGVTIHAQVFLTGLSISTSTSTSSTSNTCGKISSFTRQIISMRREEEEIINLSSSSSSKERVEGEDEVEEIEEEEVLEGEGEGLRLKGLRRKKLWNKVDYWSSDGKGEI